MNVNKEKLTAKKFIMSYYEFFAEEKVAFDTLTRFKNQINGNFKEFEMIKNRFLHSTFKMVLFNQTRLRFYFLYLGTPHTKKMYFIQINF